MKLSISKAGHPYRLAGTVFAAAIVLALNACGWAKVSDMGSSGSG